jgi:hypothetical protein
VIPAEIQSIAVGALRALISSTVFLLALFIGFLVIAGLAKLRHSGRDSLVVRNLGDRIGGDFHYLPPDAPRGPADQLHTPELLEQSGRKED